MDGTPACLIREPGVIVPVPPPNWDPLSLGKKRVIGEFLHTYGAAPYILLKAIMRHSQCDFVI